MAESRHATHLDVDVVPNADDSRFPAGRNPWRDTIQARVRAPPENGAANDELRRIVADFFGRSITDVEIVSGARSRRKRLRIAGLAAHEAQALLEGALRGS